MSSVLGGAAERLNPSTSSPLRQDTLSCVYHVISGSGRSRIGDNEFLWKAGDTFAIPSWYPYRHFADSKETAYLYRFDDKPMITALGFFREQDMDMEKLLSD